MKALSFHARVLATVAAAGIVVTVLFVAYLSPDATPMPSEVVEPPNETSDGTASPKQPTFRPSSQFDGETLPPEGVGSNRTDSASVRIGREFEVVHAGNGRIDDFIRRHLAAAKRGDPDSMHFVSEAMGTCYLDVTQFNQAASGFSQLLGTELPTTEHDWDRYRILIMDSIIGTSDYYKAQIELAIERAKQCNSLGLDTEAFRREHIAWQAAATVANHAIDVARVAAEAVAPENQANLSPGQLQQSKATIREALRANRQLETLLAAATVSIYSTGRDAVTECLSWALAACEYYDCEGSLTHLYRNNCKFASLDGATHCFAGMSDADYLRGKYPGQIDVARGRALEIKEALDNGRWEVLGLD